MAEPEPLRPDNTQLKQSDHSIVSALFPPSGENVLLISVGTLEFPLSFSLSQACPEYPGSEPYFWGSSPANVQPWVFHLDPFVLIC